MNTASGSFRGAVLFLASLVTCTSLRAADVSIAAWGINGYGQTDVPAGMTGVSQLAAGSYHSLALRTNGSVVAWGYNADGQCNVPASATNITAIAAGGVFSVALRANGAIVAWGGTNYGYPNTPLSIPSLGPAAVIAAGTYAHGVAAFSNGIVRSWGTIDGFTAANSQLNLGIVKALAAGEQHNVALLSDGTVRCWWATISTTFGYFPAEVTNTPSGLSNVMAIAAGYSHSLALLSNGTVVAWGLNDFGQINVPEGVSNVVAIAAGGNQNRALTAEGKVLTWGIPPVDPTDFMPRIAPDDLTNVISIAGSWGHTLALVTNPAPCVTQAPRNRSVPPGWPVTLSTTAAGQAPLHYQWQRDGANLAGQTNAILTFSSFQTNDAGIYRAIVTNSFGSATSRVARLVAGPVLAWGNNGSEQCWPTPEFTNTSVLAGSSSGTFAAGSDGRVFVAGTTAWTNDLAILQSVVDARSISSGYFSQLILRSNQTVVAAGSLSTLTTTPASVTNIVYAATGLAGADGFAVREDGQLLCWSESPFSPLTNVPPSMTNVIQVAANDRSFAIVLRDDGSVAAYGPSAPGTPAALSNVVSIATDGFRKPYALSSDGSVLNWNGSPVSGATNIVAMSAGTFHLLALRSDGTVFINGSTQYGQGILPGNLSNVVEVAAGSSHSIVRFGDGSPRITIDPYSRPVHAGSNSTLTAFGVGSPPLSYQWQFNGSDITDATNANFVLSNAAAGSIGGYRCIITNTSGAVTSAVASVSVVFGPPRFQLLSPAPALDTSGFSARVESLSGTGTVIIYASTNLTDWLPILTNPAGPTTFDFIDPDATNQPQRYYKAAEQR